MIVKLLINKSIKSLNRVYDYLVPEELKDKIAIGKRVLVNFGSGIMRQEEGIIVKIEENEEKAEFVNSNGKSYKLKSIIDVLDEISYIDESKLKLAKWMSQVYFCNVYDALKLMMPPGIISKTGKKHLNGKTDTLVILNKEIEDINEEIEQQKISSAKHIRILRFLIDNDFVILGDVIDGLNISRAVLKTLEKNGYIKLEKVKVEDDLIEDMSIEKTYPLVPTDEQKNAIDVLSKHVEEEEYKESLLFGITGSGKTEVYLQVIDKVLKMGKRVIVLVPEISLTHQTVTRFISRFGNKVALLHSKMTLAQRKEELKKIKENKVDIIIGARSALFAPVSNLGLVIVDEEHDSSYYSQKTPRYSTKEVAEYLCKQNNALLILGSATPDICTYYKARNNEIELIEMKQRPQGAVLPEVKIIDMKQEKVIGNNGIFSNQLKEEILKNIQRKEQTMIFLNRRGYSTYLVCNDCGYVFRCKNCDVSMTYHKKNNLLICHYCSHVEKNVTNCPKCTSSNISQGGVGTEKIEDELKSIYSDISILRMDADTTVASNAHQKILDKYKNEKIDLLVGTQMISKGHDIENVTLVGVLGVDSMLSMNDYTSSERAYANMSQVAGRAGRGSKQGRVILQTTEDDNYILDSIVSHDYVGFYEKEIEYRRNFGYPPFSDIILLELNSNDLNVLKEDCQKLYEILKNVKEEYTVFSPKSPYIQKVNNKYRINIVIKCKFSIEFLKILYQKLNQYDKIKQKNVNISIVKNPTFIG